MPKLKTVKQGTSAMERQPPGTSVPEVPRQPKKQYTASYSSEPKMLPRELAEAVLDLQECLEMPVWLCIHGAPDRAEGGEIDLEFVKAAISGTRELTRGQHMAVLFHSPGGFAKQAYQAAMCIRRYCGAFTAVVPASAKSAATLMVLGAERILLGENAELGPLDVQVFDPEREMQRSALDEVQALERLHALSLEAVDSTMFLLAMRTGKPMDKLLPLALKFSTDMMTPLLDKIDTVHFTQMSRLLKEAEEYAIRLLQPKYTEGKAKRIAAHLVEKYPEHGFVIDSDELKRIGLQVEGPTAVQSSLLESIAWNVDGVNAVGFLKETGL